VLILRPNSDAVARHHHEVTPEALPVLFNNCAQNTCLLCSASTYKAKQNDATRQTLLPECEEAKVLVLSQKHSAAGLCSLKYLKITEARGLLIDMGDLMAIFSKLTHNVRWDVLVGEEPQAAESPIGCVSSLDSAFAA